MPFTSTAFGYALSSAWTNASEAWQMTAMCSGRYPYCAREGSGGEQRSVRVGAWVAGVEGERRVRQQPHPCDPTPN